MKIRTDFVTNSSSSSFILSFKSKEDGLAKIAALAESYGSKYVAQLLMDFFDEAPFSKDELFDRVKDDLSNDASYVMSFGSGWYYYEGKNTFRNRWEAAHPDASYEDYYNSPEYKEEMSRLVSEYYAKMLETIGDDDYLVELEYEDHSDVGSELEHGILPECDFTVRRFSHH